MRCKERNEKKNRFFFQCYRWPCESVDCTENASVTVTRKKRSWFYKETGFLFFRVSWTLADDKSEMCLMKRPRCCVILVSFNERARSTQLHNLLIFRRSVIGMCSAVNSAADFVSVCFWMCVRHKLKSQWKMLPRRTSDSRVVNAKNTNVCVERRISIRATKPSVYNFIFKLHIFNFMSVDFQFIPTNSWSYANETIAHLSIHNICLVPLSGYN